MNAAPALAVVGTGTRLGTDLGANVCAVLKQADEVYYLASDPVSDAVLLDLRPDALSFSSLYADDVERPDSYAAMVERILERINAGRRVCFAVPGHPGVFAQPTHEAIRRARAAGFEAVMIPALSAVDHLYADLAIDPGEPGSACYDATDFIVYGRRPDPTSALLLWQIGAIGETHRPRELNRHGLTVLTEVLLETYVGSHDVVVYEASRYVFSKPTILHVRLDELPRACVPVSATLYVPPAHVLKPDRDRVARLWPGVV